ncbi:siderophore-interacting protein [Psychrobacter sp. YP14]|uniref:siderophore-interacting protein n=1 Tax=Psychrobacter sp. YP14 TaxID=2203895 RepID=UPI000D7D76A1|nr:siderophore-interacting protein [Psychrobacter sp. YP14]AWT49160.1 siderophore-interacting protein [Psychrobacter sp. YP14]
MSAKSSYTPLQDINAKLDIIEHLNQDHTEEVQSIAEYYYPDLNIKNPVIVDIYEEGMLISAQTKQATETLDELFIEFKLKGDLEEQVLYLAYVAMTEQGRDLTGNKKHYFEVIGKQRLTTNMTRLTLKSETPLPEDYAGYAYGMILKTLNKTTLEEPSLFAKLTDSVAGNLSGRLAENENVKRLKENLEKRLKKQVNKAFLWVLKKVSSEKREKIVKSINKDIRLYTLRSAWSSRHSSFNDEGYMDIYTHDGSAGSVWTDDLNVGDIVFSRNETDDKHKHLDNGQTVLIADETAYPALAGILDFWQNVIPPHIIILSQQASEQDYFDDTDFPEGAIVHRITSPYEEQGIKTVEILKDIETIDGVWGAFENKSCKVVRHYLRNERGLSGKNNHIKAYWRAGS